MPNGKDNTENIVCPFCTLILFNEWYAASTSKKILAVMQANARQGKYTASIVAYGYIAETDENLSPIIDENTAPNV
ncbi:MAG: hypothetical protein K2N27_03605 [Ruminococcus sp.]|nr:hypothetical protein [Ruminococcus sp.]